DCRDHCRYLWIRWCSGSSGRDRETPVLHFPRGVRHHADHRTHPPRPYWGVRQPPRQFLNAGPIWFSFARKTKPDLVRILFAVRIPQLRQRMSTPKPPGKSGRVRQFNFGFWSTLTTPQSCADDRAEGCKRESVLHETVCAEEDCAHWPAVHCVNLLCRTPRLPCGEYEERIQCCLRTAVLVSQVSVPLQPAPPAHHSSPASRSP